MSGSGLDEGQNVRVEFFGFGLGKAMRRTRIDLERRILDDLGGL
jgi:hypothetical protein